MAYFYRLIFAMLCVVVVVGSPAYASFPPPTATLYGAQSFVTGNYFTPSHGTIAAACEEGRAQAESYGVTSVTPGADGALTCTYNYSGGSWVGGVTTSSGPVCPSSSTLSGGVCTCTAPSVQNSTNDGCTTVQVCDWNKNDILGKSLTVGDLEITKGSTLICYYGCQWTVGATQDFWWKNAAGVYVGYANAGQMVGNGLPCNGTEGANAGGGPASTEPPVNPEPFPKPPCAAGYIPGTVTIAGITTTLCSPAIDTERVKEKVTTEAVPEGTKQVTSSDVTVCNVAGSCTTTTTISTSINGSAPTSTTSTATQSKESYCAEATGKKECGTGSGSWSGNCDAGFVGEGDPVTVAMAREIHTQNCLLNKQTAESAKYADAATKTGDQTGSLPGNQTIGIGSANFDSSDAIGGASCIADKTVVVAGVSVTLPFSTVCPWLGYLKTLLLAVSYLAAAAIVFKR